ncbi:CIC11C00000002568 [Sungouiella intermedia]|uniref:CIC11C00000002568 n=1 Tax=Sungouiella intermedia TaxID=45354 RepID=A0A1L0BQJ5_9ASCO|nr:CIC11C00000002568 [[Candida] intermedia]
MTADTVVPVFRTPKRRLVDPTKRKKASFSCDRCKVRKIACQRPNPSSPCAGCVKANYECSTTIKRKKKIRGPIENIGLHYKCLHVLVMNLFPEIDVNNIDALINLGELQGIQMPSRFGGTSEKEAKELRELSIVITTGRVSGSPRSQDEVELKEDFSDEKSPVPLQNEVKVDDEEPDNKSLVVSPDQELCVPHKDYIIIDLGGNSHCIGPLGAPGFMDLYLRIIGHKGGVDLLKWTMFQKIAKGEMIISSSHDPIQQKDLNFLYSESFPYYGAIGRRAAEYYVEVFFRHVHLRYLCFNETLFRETHDRFWAVVESGVKDKLSNQAICCIYMVWILGRLYDPTDLTVTVDEATMQKYIHIIKLCLSDTLLTATLDGVRVLLLLSVYLDNSKKRETGYILVELAARQAVTLGINRKSLSSCTEDEDKKEEMRRIWWTVFIMEVCFSTQMGRSSSIQIEDVNMDYPTCQGLDIPSCFPKAYVGQVELTKCLYDVLQYRKSLTRSCNILSVESIAKAVVLQKNLTQTFHSMDPTLLDLSDFEPSKLVLHFRYNYYCLLLTLPFFLHVANTLSVRMNESIVFLINQCARLSVDVARLIELTAQHELLNGTLFPDIFYAYHAVMGLVVFYLMLKDKNFGSAIEFPMPVLDKALAQIKALQLSLSKLVGGTLLKISRYIDAFIAGLDYLKCRPVQPITDMSKDKEYHLIKPSNIGSRFVATAQVKQESIPTPMPEPEVEMDDFLLFQGRLSFGESTIGSVDFGDILLSDFGFPTLDGGLGEGLFKMDGF